MSEFEIRDVPSQHTAAIAVSATTEDISEVMGEGFSKAFDAVTRAGATPAGPPLARYFAFGGTTLAFECAIPVAAPFAGDGEVKPSSVGGGPCVVYTHVGPYATLRETWEAMLAWIGEQGRTSAGPGWESYLTDPGAEPDPAKYVTEIYLPVE